MYTNDRRNNRAWIQENFGSSDGKGWAELKDGSSPDLVHTNTELDFEHGFSWAEKDILWHKDTRENDLDLLIRVDGAIKRILAENLGTKRTVLSLTMHSSTMSATCKVLGRVGNVSLPVGEIVPFVVRVEGR